VRPHRAVAAYRDPVFRPAPSRSLLTVVLPALVAAATTSGLVLARLLASGNPFDRMWAEDGKTLLANADRLSSLTESYAGYGLGLLRALAFVGGRLPVAHWAEYAVLASSLVVGLLAGFSYAAARALTGSTPAAALAALSMALTPALAFESLGSMANLGWYLLVAALWAVLLPEGTLTRTAAVVAGVTAATTVLAALLLPAALLVHRRRVLRVRAVQAMAAGFLFQAVVILFGTAESGGPERHPGVPEAILEPLLNHLGGTRVEWPLLTWAAVAGVLVTLVVGWRFAGRLRPHLAAAVGTAALVLAGPTVISGELASRYIAAACMLVLVGAAIAVGSTTWALPSLGLLAAVAVIAFPAHPIKFSGPSWNAGVTEWARQCDAGATEAAIPVSPEGWGEARVSCALR
jgi:hypothetical protein